VEPHQKHTFAVTFALILLPRDPVKPGINIHAKYT